MTTYADVKKQIAQLEKKAADLRKVEVAKAVANIREQMAKYELTVDDIAPVKSSAKVKVVTRNPKVKAGKPAKYMDPKSGKTWTGHGKAPGWIAAATKGGRRDDFLIEKVTLAKESKPAVKSKSSKSVTAKKTPTADKKPKVVAKKAPVAKKTPATAKSRPATNKVKVATLAKKPATKAPAKSPAKPKSVSKPTAKPAASMKASKKGTAKSSPAATVATSTLAA